MNDNFFVFTSNKLKKIIEQILNTNKNIDNVKEDIQTVQADITNLDARIDELKNDIQTSEMNSLGNSLQIIKNSLLHPAILKLDSVDNVEVGDPVDMLIGVPNKNILIDDGWTQMSNITSSYYLNPSNLFKIEDNEDDTYTAYFIQPLYTYSDSSNACLVHQCVMNSSMIPLSWQKQSLYDYLSYKSNSGINIFDAYYDENTGIEYFVCPTGESSNTDSYIIKKKGDTITSFAFTRDFYSEFASKENYGIHLYGCNRSHIGVISEDLLVFTVGTYIYLIQLSNDTAVIHQTYNLLPSDSYKDIYDTESDCTGSVYVNKNTKSIYHICRRSYNTSSHTYNKRTYFEVNIFTYDETNYLLTLVKTETLITLQSNDSSDQGFSDGTVLTAPKQSVILPKSDSDNWVIPIVLHTSNTHAFIYWITITPDNNVSSEYFDLPSSNSKYFICPNFVSAEKVLFPYYDGTTKISVAHKGKGITEKIDLGVIEYPDSSEYGYGSIYPIVMKDMLMYFHACPNQASSSSSSYYIPKIYNLYKAPAYQLGLVTNIDKTNNIIEVAQSGACYASVSNVKGALIKSNYMHELGRYQSSSIIELYNYDSEGNKIV